MHPTAARSNRSSFQSSIPSTSTPSSLLHPQQQQILYGPIVNPMLTLQRCSTGLHPSCIYPGAQRNAGLPNSVPLQIQGKSSRWPPKNKLLRTQQYCQQQQQQQHIQQQLSYNPKPLFLYDQTTNNGPPPAPSASFLVASSTYTHGSFSGDQYNNSGVTLIPQPYHKPPDIQSFCFIQDRQSTQQQQPHEQSSHGSYYNISATNSCNLQTVNANSTFQFSNLSPYASTNFTSNQISGPIQTIQSTQIFPNPSVNLVFDGVQRDKPAPSSALDVQAFKCTKSKLLTVSDSQITPNTSDNYNVWPSQTNTSSANSLFDVKPNTNDINQGIAVSSLDKVVSNVSTKTQEEHYSDESSASFDFTIEAEKMVSALCNTSLNDLGKEETKNSKPSSAPLFNGAGDTISNKNAWFTDLCTDYGTNTSVAVQTDDSSVDRTQFPELLRKVVYWGCTEAEIVLNNCSKINPRSAWLKDLSVATKTAVTKSSTCFPIFAGDRIFVSDLINALLRIGNGWLILDNYLNKQHYPSLDEKLDRELVRCFQLWEENTHELLNQIVQTFLKLEGNSDASNLEQKPESFGASFPGDVSVYTNYDLFDPPSTITTNTSRQESSNKKNSQDTPFNGTQIGSLRNLSLPNVSQEKQFAQKESKPRNKWTVTENLTAIDSTKSAPDMFLGHTETGVQASSRFRTRGNSSAKIDTSTQSLNAEFFHLKSKILTENNQDSSKQWTFKEKKQEFPENKLPSQEEPNSGFRLQRQLDEKYENNYTQKYLSKVDSSFLNPSINLESAYFASNNETENFYPNYLYPSYAVDYADKNLKNLDYNHGNKTNMDLVYVGKSSTNQLELAAVPKDKMTLLSQIEPSIPDKSSEEMTANLSAWFASMRNSDNRQMPFMNINDVKTGNVVPRLSSHQEMSKNTMDLSNCIRQLQINANRQFQTLQNMQSIQSAPWNAYNLINNHIQVQQVPEEYDSSEDVRVYMKPGSYNVPKKRHQRRSNRRADNTMQRNVASGASSNYRNHYTSKEKVFNTPASSTPVSRITVTPTTTSVNNLANAAMKLPFPATPIVPPPTFSLENSPRILKRSDSSNYTVSQDVTWKAACASAEILLEALNVKEDADSKKKDADRGESDPGENHKNIKKDDNNDTTSQLSQKQEKIQDSFSKTLKSHNDGCAGASSYEASEDDSESTSRFSPNTSINEISQLFENKNGSSKTNVKTDSWLIKTLNNANMVNKQKWRKSNADPRSSESSNSSVTENEQTTSVFSLEGNNATPTAATTTAIKNLQQMTCSRKSSCTLLNNDQTTSEETERIVGKATYSETVRRCTSLSTSQLEKKEFCKKAKLNVINASTICSTVIPIPGRKCQKKDPEKSYYLLHNRSRKCSGKKSMKNCDMSEPQLEEISLTAKSATATKHGKKKENAGCIEFLDGKFGGKASDRGWSVWYSSKRKQSLSPLALSKLEMIHQTVWEMKEAEIFKCPSSGNSGSQTSTHTIEEYCKVIKSPMFLETVEYKLKNRVYHKVEHAVRDFRRIVYNSKLYHKDDQDRVKTIESLSKKLEELFEEHFSSWDFDNISGSPREDTPMPQRFKSTGQKPVTGRYGTKKSPSSSIAENI
ncbi:uncharacterized protein LOC143187158 [Calliopsis andreniformis]|uniref:uncharacterized protein LOC143187158 n=1 Tax=Calliopsis andreniformis TaxID=337506 RepID=UPI003FCE7D04